MTITESNAKDMDISGNKWGYLGELHRNGQIYKDTVLAQLSVEIALKRFRFTSCRK